MRRAAACILLLLLCGSAHAAAPDFGPWSADARHPVMARAAPRPVPALKAPPGAGSPFSVAFLFWSRLLPRVAGPRCAHRPSCSSYAHQAMARYGLPKGAWLALNRLMRGAHSSVLRRLPMVRGASGIFFLDPLP